MRWRERGELPLPRLIALEGVLRMVLRGIRARLLALIIATVVPFAVLIGAGLWMQWRSDQAEALKSALIDARLVAAQVDDQLGAIESLLAGLSRAVSPDPAATAGNDTTLRQVKNELAPYVSTIGLFSLDGWNIGTSADGVRIYVGDRAYFRRVLAGERLAIGSPIFGRVAHQWVIVIARPVADRAGELRAVLIVSIMLDRFQDALRARELPAGSVIQVVNEDGIVLTRSADSARWIGRDLHESQHGARYLAARAASGPVHWPDGVERITSSAEAVRAPWLVSVGLPTDIAFAHVVARLVWGSVAALAALVIALALAWWFSGAIITPLRQLSTDAAALATGNLSHRTDVATPDEVGALAHTFNAMAASLEERHRELDAAREAAATEAMERALLEEMQRLAKETLTAVIDASPVAIVCSDVDRRIMLWSRAAEQMFGYTSEEMVGRLTTIVPPEGKAESQKLFERALNGDTVRAVPVKRMRKDGSLVDVTVAAARMYHVDGTVRGVAWAYEDITHRKQAEEQLERLAHYDQLTGLPNRLTLNKELAWLLGPENQGRPTSIALFDLDGFKDVNDTLGHSVGDRLLVAVGHRLAELARGRGRVCRLGGDEFVVIVPDCGDPREIAGIADAMLRGLAAPLEIHDHVLHLAGSAGVAIAPSHGTTIDELIANADLALYDAKSSGGGTYRFFQPVLRAQAQARRALDLELRRAFERQEFVLYFQPQIRLVDGAAVGAEALLRWRHASRGILSPGAFIAALGESPIAPAVGRWILRTACAQAVLWRAKGIPLARMSVNLFPPQLGDDTLMSAIEDALDETGLPADVLELEITENVALNHHDSIVPLQQLHDKGIRVTLDDFGTGYASLNSLTRLPLSRIKIDREFVAKITESAEDAAIVRSLIAMAHNLGLGVIAEGVETEAQAAFLLGEGCEEAQGFLYGGPVPAAAFEAYFDRDSMNSVRAART
jgi:diguanylate cyclase (GGDEF)-like protein/PAS domain S-box-containing protein